MKPMFSGMSMSLLLAMYYLLHPPFTPFFCWYCVLLCFISINFLTFHYYYVLCELQYNFEGRYDIVRFIKLIQKAGLYAHIRIGPYVCAEWNFGYLPCFSLQPSLSRSNSVFRSHLYRSFGFLFYFLFSLLV